MLRSLFDHAIDAVDPLIVVPPHLPAAPEGRTIVIGAGKASARMALAVEQHWQGPISGAVVTRYGHGEICQHIEIMEAGHPVPDHASNQAAIHILSMVNGLTEDDLVICLISGGGSSLLALPAPGMSLEDERDVNDALLKSGATIREMNCVRRHLSAIKGGRLALACYPAKVVTLVISDVPGDDPASVASGPTVADFTTPGDALIILSRYAIPLSAAMEEALSAKGNTAPTPEHPKLCKNRTIVVAGAQLALDAAAGAARRAGYTPLILGNSIEGEARDVATMHAGIVRQILQHNQPLPAPCVVLSGGETTVTVRGNGRGGRNAEFLLAMGIALDGLTEVHAIACDTDGIDGTEDNAGCFLSPESISVAKAKGIDPRRCLSENNGYEFFKSTGQLIITGPTRTNVNDFRAILIERP